jgi:hypothetical protein
MGPIDHAHTASANLLQDSIMRDCLTNHRRTEPRRGSSSRIAFLESRNRIIVQTYASVRLETFPEWRG